MGCARSIINGLAANGGKLWGASISRNVVHSATVVNIFIIIFTTHTHHKLRLELSASLVRMKQKFE